jgi:hypothetical protein
MALSVEDEFTANPPTNDAADCRGRKQTSEPHLITPAHVGADYVSLP